MSYRPLPLPCLSDRQIVERLCPKGRIEASPQAPPNRESTALTASPVTPRSLISHEQ